MNTAAIYDRRVTMCTKDMKKTIDSVVLKLVSVASVLEIVANELHIDGKGVEDNYFMLKRSSDELTYGWRDLTSMMSRNNMLDNRYKYIFGPSGVNNIDSTEISRLVIEDASPEETADICIVLNKVALAMASSAALIKKVSRDSDGDVMDMDEARSIFYMVADELVDVWDELALMQWRYLRPDNYSYLDRNFARIAAPGIFD